MIHHVPNRIPISASRRPEATGLAFCLLIALCWGSISLHAQQPPPEPPQEEGSTTETTVDPFSTLGLPGEAGVCPPPSRQEQIMIGVGSVALLVVCFFLLVRLTERRYIQQDRSATMGRHVGFSLTLFLSAFGFLALAYLITGCIHPSVWLWLAFWGAIWLIHGFYTLIAVRGN